MAILDEFESAGVHVGQAIGSVFSDIEYVLIRNRRELFKAAIRADDRFLGFSNAVGTGVKSMTAQNIQQCSKLLEDARELMTLEMKKKYQEGVDLADKTVAHYTRQGFRPLTNEPARPPEQSPLFRSKLNLSLSQLALIMGSAILAAEIQSQVIASTARTPEEIDEVQMSFLDDGFRHEERDIVASAEFVARNTVHDEFLTAHGERAERLGLPALVRVSAHPSSCPLCFPFQNQILIDDHFRGGMKDGKHGLLSDAIDDGLFHFNCRHELQYYVEEMESPELLEREKQPVQENINTYAVEQNQRYNERHIRQYKRRMEGAMTDNAREDAKRKVTEWQARQRQLEKYAKQNNIQFYRQYERESLGGLTLPVFRL